MLISRANLTKMSENAKCFGLNCPGNAKCFGQKCPGNGKCLWMRGGPEGDFRLGLFFVLGVRNGSRGVGAVRTQSYGGAVERREGDDQVAVLENGGGQRVGVAAVGA